MKKIHRERLLQVARMGRELPRRKKEVDLNVWVKCKTVACMLGHAGMDPWFTRRGFRTCQEDGDIEYKSASSWRAACSFFGLCQSNALHLFSKAAYPGEQKNIRSRVIKRIEKFVREAA